MHAVIFAGGTVRSGKAVTESIAKAELVLACDSGALSALRYGCTPAIVVGDFDSLTMPLSELEARGCRIVRVPAEKNETDSELAIQVALEQGATLITLLGALGGARIDHTLANILLLAGFASVPIRIVDGPSCCWLLRGPGRTTVQGQPGDLLSLLPLTAEASGVCTSELYYPLFDETLYFGNPRGMSNVLQKEQAEISLQSGLLFVSHTSLEELKEQEAGHEGI
ncbi:thiamine diphosphokinase [Ktedonosporobacter rubrisoli]|nr:thiamine diphosphokinase [Ktedonosporobacter rubrisoli]